MMGKHLSEETRKKIGAANRGRIPSEETRQKLRDARLGWHHSPETRAKILASLNRPEVAAKLRAKRALRIFPLYDTKPEIAVQGWLLSHGIEFTKHRCIPGLNHQWDIKIESQKTLVEVDGCYWHACPVHRPNSHVDISRQYKNDRIARAAGWRVIRIWEHDIKAGDFSPLRRLLHGESMTSGEWAVFAAAWAYQVFHVDGTNLEQKAEAAAHAVQAMRAVDVTELTPAAAAMVKEMRGETT